MVSPSKPVPFKFKLNFKLRLEYICKNTESSWYWIQRNNLYWVDTQKLFHHQICEDAFPPLPLYISLLNMKYPWGSFISNNSTGKRWKKLRLSCAKLSSSWLQTYSASDLMIVYGANSLMWKNVTWNFLDMSEITV